MSLLVTPITLGINATIASVALGARLIEKHFTKDKNYSSFRDHKISADPDEFSKMVKSVREVELMLGNEKTLFNTLKRRLSYLCADQL